MPWKAVSGIAGIWLALVNPVASVQPAPTVRPIELVTPAYPPIAASARVVGAVVVTVHVSPDSSVSDVVIESGPPLLAEASRSAAATSRFMCFQCVGPQAYTITYTFGFDMPARTPTVGALQAVTSCAGRSVSWEKRNVEEAEHVQTPVDCTG